MNPENDSESNLDDIVLSNRNARIEHFDFERLDQNSNVVSQNLGNSETDTQSIYSLKKLSKQSDSEVWKYFGRLYKNSKF